MFDLPFNRFCFFFYLGTHAYFRHNIGEFLSFVQWIRIFRNTVHTRRYSSVSVFTLVNNREGTLLRSLPLSLPLLLLLKNKVFVLV